jgi:hypothetical protein
MSNYQRWDGGVLMSAVAETQRWWKFSDYEIREGWIRPTKGAQLMAHDAFHDFTPSGPASAPAKSPTRRPYSALLEIDALARKRSDREGYEARLTGAILDHCAAHGLLGIALDRTERVVFSPRVEDEARHGIPELGRVVVQRGYQRSGGRWELVPPRVGEGSSAPVGSCPRIDYERHALFVRPEVSVANRVTREIRSASLAKGWAPYFPDVPSGQEETFEYPALFSDEFWRLYAEPIDELIHAVRNFAFAIRCVQHCLHPDPALPADLQRTLREALPTELEKLNQWLSRVSPAIALQDDGELVATWVASSLLSMMAVLAHLDLTSRGRILTCVECRRVFYSRARAAKYCSRTCRQTTHTRNYRARLRAASSPPTGGR